MAVSVTVIYAQYFIVFPGIISHGNWTFTQKDNPWRTVIIVGSWNAGDAIGRYAPIMCGKSLPPKMAVCVLALAKFGLVWTSMLCVKSYNPSSNFFMSMPVQVANLIANSVSFGVLGTYAMIVGTTNKAQVGYSQKVAGYLMASHLIIGTGLGGLIGNLLNEAVIRKD